MNKTAELTGKAGFTLIEVIVGIFLVAVALLGLAQIFSLSILQNTRAGDISNATFLAQQEIDQLRTMTAIELNAMTGAPLDEQLDMNSDGTLDYRRITVVQAPNPNWEIRVLVFPPAYLFEDRDTMLADPRRFKVQANVQTIISR